MPETDKFLKGQLLLDSGQLRGSFFQRTVVLICQHDAEGAFGLVLNRPAPIKDAPLPVCIGGPCKFEGFLLLHGHAEWLKDPASPQGQIIAGVYLGDASVMEKITDPTPGDNLRFRMFAGYSGWGANQLENELGQGAWAVVPAEAAHVFDIPPEDLWDEVVPPSIPEPSVN